MDQQLIIQPLLGMLLLTAAVWLLMYARRLPFILSNHIDPQSIATPELLNSVIPAQINNPSNNLKNLFELPVVFYVLCVLLLLAQKVDQVFLSLAWTYVGLRVIHSLIHCSINNVNLRFTAFMLSSLVLWFMLLRFALTVF